MKFKNKVIEITALQSIIKICTKTINIKVYSIK